MAILKKFDLKSLYEELKEVNNCLSFTATNNIQDLLSFGKIRKKYRNDARVGAKSRPVQSTLKACMNAHLEPGRCLTPLVHPFEIQKKEALHLGHGINLHISRRNLTHIPLDRGRPFHSNDTQPKYNGRRPQGQLIYLPTITDVL